MMLEEMGIGWWLGRLYGQNWQSNKSDQVIENKTQLAFEQRRTAEQPQPQLQPSADRVTEVCEDDTCALSPKQVDRQNVVSGQQLIDAQKEVRRPDGKRRIIPLSFSSGSKPTRLPSGSMFRDSNCVAAPLDSLSAPTTAAPLPPNPHPPLPPRRRPPRAAARRLQVARTTCSHSTCP